MTQTQTLAILDAGHSVFLTGPAGSGKTFVLQQFIRSARAEGKSVAVTASTGLAATHLGGVTIHSWAGIGIADELHKKIISDMPKSRQEQIASVDVLIIDEVSMLHDFRLDMVDEITKQVRKNDAPFGGLQVVLAGDFFQLPPVNRSEGLQSRFVPYARSWESLQPVICYLEEQHRQDDDILLEILTALRSNDIRRRHAEQLLARKRVRTPFDDPATELHTRNIDVDAVNNEKLAAMPGVLHRYEMMSTGKKKAVETLKKACLAPEELLLKEGAFVMFVKNATDKKYANGTLGTVIGFDETTDYPVVQTVTGRIIETKPESWEMRDGEKKIATLSQLPLRLAWAITVHKSQGMTLDAAHIDLSTAFVPGMGYVALSRVRKLETLTLAGINKTALTMHEEAYELDVTLRKLSLADSKRFDHLVEPFLAKQNEAKVKETTKSSGSWQAKLEKMRKTYPNAYKQWKALEDTTLLEAWNEGKTVPELAKVLGRHEGGIRARLKKHLGESLFS